MIVRGIISKINTADNSAEVILPEYDNAVTAPLKFNNPSGASTAVVGGKVVVAVFDKDQIDLNDAMIL